MIGYKFDTEQEAQIARKTCADYYGLPISPEDDTIYWINYSYAELNSPPFWYMAYDDSVQEILGDPIEFDVTEINF